MIVQRMANPGSVYDRAVVQGQSLQRSAMGQNPLQLPVVCENHIAKHKLPKLWEVEALQVALRNIVPARPIASSFGRMSWS